MSRVVEMASTKMNFPTPDFILSLQQQDLLFAALNSNGGSVNTGSLGQAGDLASMRFDNLPPLQAPGSRTLTISMIARLSITIMISITMATRATSTTAISLRDR